ncbi:LuxR family transcriptional regulator [Meridianimarinicoccus roseus]|jgi:DNA-binding CsgD family transcriptional regulator|uniref:LuxR family transcriptional regulator n=1 Tax=Meridianimarinicoccus roseus TaxID=2072018 RepID=A0A2V2L847_9RHOB|nr:autoinducer binding domain-containing protein [Meridianimarinicoccus roseus]PWR01355.1 LuxR family transcriptional regulator [Meridianimarinicoccus roseus]
MKDKLEALITGLEAAKTHSDLQGIIVKLRDLYDVDHVIYHSVNRAGEQYAALTYDPSWVERYIEQDYARIDPVVQGCYQRFHPVDWKRLDWSSPRARNFMGEAADAGVGNQGLSVPIRGPNGQFALFTACSRATDSVWESYSRSNVGDLILVAHFINQKALELDNGTDVQKSASLSPREVDTLRLLAMGYSRAQAADCLCISEHTLRVYIESARFKLAAQNTTHAVAKAIAHGLIVI